MTISFKAALCGSTAAALCLTATLAGAASHREAPGIAETPKIDGTDFYFFRSYEEGREDYVTFIANYQPIQSPYGGPNYFTMDSDALYEIMIDNDGDAVEDLTFSFSFTNKLATDGGIALDIGGTMVAIPLRQAGEVTRDQPNAALNDRERFRVALTSGDRRSGDAQNLTQADGGEVFVKPIDYIGTKTLPDYEAYVANYIYDDVVIPGCDMPGRVFAGQRAEAFAVNLGPVFDLVNFVPIQGGFNPVFPQYGTQGDAGFAGGIMQSADNDDLMGANVTSLALEIPISCLTEGTDPVIGAWTTSSLPQGAVENPFPGYDTNSIYGGAWVQQSRLSNPLVNELVIGLPDKDLFNAVEPSIDATVPRVVAYVTNPTLPALLNIVFNSNLEFGTPDIAPSNFPRDDLFTTFLTGFPGFNASSNPNAVPSEMMRLNTAVPPTPVADQNVFGLVAEDLAGFPNGRRPSDDVVDIALRVMMGALCHPVPLGQELSGDPTAEDSILLFDSCGPEDAPTGTIAFTDGAPLNPSDLQAVFPYLNTPLPGSQG